MFYLFVSGWEVYNINVTTILKLLTKLNKLYNSLNRGGLAERLNGLQNRERSAISLWRHQCVSYEKTLSGKACTNIWDSGKKNIPLKNIFTLKYMKLIITIFMILVFSKCATGLTNCSKRWVHSYKSNDPSP